MNSRAMERMSLENSLRYAIERGEFSVHYQPVIQVATNKMVGTEALLRWNRPGGEPSSRRTSSRSPKRRG